MQIRDLDYHEELDRGTMKSVTGGSTLEERKDAVDAAYDQRVKQAKSGETERGFPLLFGTIFGSVVYIGTPPGAAIGQAVGETSSDRTQSVAFTPRGTLSR